MSSLWRRHFPFVSINRNWVYDFQNSSFALIAGQRTPTVWNPRISVRTNGSVSHQLLGLILPMWILAELALRLNQTESLILGSWQWNPLMGFCCYTLLWRLSEVCLILGLCVSLVFKHVASSVRLLSSSWFPAWDATISTPLFISFPST